MSNSSARTLLLITALLGLTGCALDPASVRASDESDLSATLELMARARLAEGEEWLRLHNVLASAAVMNPRPELRARVALALSVGERSPEELARAQELMNTLLADSAESAIELPEGMRNLLLVQRDLVQTTRKDFARIEALEKTAARRRAALTKESAAHARTRDERDEARAALTSAQKKLRQVTRIELKHEASGS